MWSNQDIHDYPPMPGTSDKKMQTLLNSLQEDLKCLEEGKEIPAANSRRRRRSTWKGLSGWHYENKA